MVGVDELFKLSDFPTRVGVNRVTLKVLKVHLRFPHTCGGEPQIETTNNLIEKISPHVWG